MNRRLRLQMVYIFAVILSLGVASSQTDPINDKATTGAVISQASGIIGALYENSGNPKSPQAFKDYAKGVVGDVAEFGAVEVTKELIIKSIINKGAEAYVAARAAGNYAAAEAIKTATISKASAAGAAFATGAFIAAVAAAVFVGVLIPAHTDPDPCDIDPSKCGPNQPPANPPTVAKQEASPTDNSKSNTQGAVSSSNGKISPSFGSSSEKSDLGGINFTSIKLNYISLSNEHEGEINFDFGLIAQKAEGASPGIDHINSTLLSATAFMTGLAVPDDKFWVNLNPWEPDRIIDEQLRQSEVGRIMLEADLQMKKDYSNYENPCINETGKALSSLLDEKREALVQQCMDKFPGEIDSIDNVWFIPVTRHWIVPDTIYAYTNETQIYIINKTLTIYSEPISDKSLFRLANQDRTTLSRACLEELDKSAKEFSDYYREMGDQMILPYIIWDVNRGEKYEDLRNVFVALALAQWHKSSITASKDVFQGSLDSSNSALLISLGPWSAEEVWEKCAFSFNNGEYKCWKNTTIDTTTGTIAKSVLSTSGGVSFYDIKDHLIQIEGIPSEVQAQINKAVTDGSINVGKEILFGNRLHLESMHNASIAGSNSEAKSSNLDPILALEWYNKGIALNDQGKYDEAIEAFNEAIRRNPNLALAWGNKGAALFSQGKYDEAIKACNEAIRLDPNYAYAWNNKGSALGMQHKYDDAIKAYDEAIRLDPNYTDARSNKEEILKALGGRS